MAELAVTMVPTLVTYQAMAEIGAKLGLPERNVSKNEGVFDAGRRSIEVAKQAGVELGFGTDLLGEAQSWQNRELAIRAELEPTVDVLRSIYHTNARLCRLEGEIGVVRPGACADVLVGRADPLGDLSAYAEPTKALSSVISQGRIVFDRDG
jgi:imidazolonepropionase-like amidohydrolase